MSQRTAGGDRSSRQSAGDGHAELCPGASQSKLVGSRRRIWCLSKEPPSGKRRYRLHVFKHFSIGAYEDRYRKRVKELIARKRKGKELVRPKEEE